MNPADLAALSDDDLSPDQTGWRERVSFRRRMLQGRIDITARADRPAEGKGSVTSTWKLWHPLGADSPKTKRAREPRLLPECGFQNQAANFSLRCDDLNKGGRANERFTPDDDADDSAAARY